MNEETAKKVLEILKEADGRCPNCVSDLMVHFVEAFPEFKALAVEYWRTNFGPGPRPFF